MRRKIAHYYYECGHELQVFAEDEQISVLDKDGNHPVCPVRFEPFPYDGSVGMSAFDYETLGLYFRYRMIELGWG